MIGRSVFLVNDTSVSGHPGCVTVMSVIRDHLEMRGLSVTGRWPMGAEPQLGLAASAALRRADVVVINGEGTIHNTETRPGARRLLHSIKRVRAATSAPLFLINATIENLRPRDFAVLKLCQRVFLRDSYSCAYAAANGIDASFSPDLCFSAGYAAQPRQEGLVVTDSTLPQTTASLRRWGSAADARFLPMQHSRLRSMLHWAVTPRRHERAARRYFGAISSAAALVTGRFHAAVFALMGETPFLALGSNTSKIQALLDDVLGGHDRFVTLDGLAAPGVEVPPFTAEESRRIRAYRAAAQVRANSMFDHIAQAAALNPGRAA